MPFHGDRFDDVCAFDNDFDDAQESKRDRSVASTSSKKSSAKNDSSSRSTGKAKISEPSSDSRRTRKASDVDASCTSPLPRAQQILGSRRKSSSRLSSRKNKMDDSPKTVGSCADSQLTGTTQSTRSSRSSQSGSMTSPHTSSYRSPRRTLVGGKLKVDNSPDVKRLSLSGLDELFLSSRSNEGGVTSSQPKLMHNLEDASIMNFGQMFAGVKKPIGSATRSARRQVVCERNDEHDESNSTSDSDSYSDDDEESSEEELIIDDIDDSNSDTEKYVVSNNLQGKNQTKSTLADLFAPAETSIQTCLPSLQQVLQAKERLERIRREKISAGSSQRRNSTTAVPQNSSRRNNAPPRSNSAQSKKPPRRIASESVLSKPPQVRERRAKSVGKVEAESIAAAFGQDSNPTAEAITFKCSTGRSEKPNSVVKAEQFSSGEGSRSNNNIQESSSFQDFFDKNSSQFIMKGATDEEETVFGFFS